MDVTIKGHLKSNTLPCLLLVVPESKYSTRVPVLLGTNFLYSVTTGYQELHGPRYLQKCRISTPWFIALRSINITEQRLTRENYQLEVVKSASPNKIVIHPNRTITVVGNMCHRTDGDGAILGVSIYTETPFVLYLTILINKLTQIHIKQYYSKF